MNIQIENPTNREIITFTLVEPKFVNFDLKQVNKSEAVGVSGKGTIIDGVEKCSTISCLFFTKHIILNWESL